MKRLVLLVLIASAMLYPEPAQWAASEINLEDINLYRYVIKADGQEKEFYSFHSDTAKILAEENIVLGSNDYFSMQYENGVYYVNVVRCREEFVKEIVEIPFTVEYKNSTKITKGLTQVTEKGQPGLKEIMYKVVMEEGREKYREPYWEVITKSPKPEIVLKGQKTKAIIASRKPAHVERIVAMEASAYTHTGSRTFTGSYPEVGTIAVDPKIIPLGTRLWIEGYGYGIAQDTGKAIKGNKVDLFMDSKRECLHWGRRKVKVYILPAK